MRAGSTLDLERTIELPPTIVWDALIDPDLVVGWLADAAIDPRIGGRYDLTWQRDGVRRVAPGIITQLRQGRLLTVDAAQLGMVSFRLTDVPGGSRGTSTRLQLQVTLGVDPEFAAHVHADWETRLDQLEGVLRGHPVDWANWAQDHGEDWTAYADEYKQGPRRPPPDRGTFRRQLR